MGSGRGGRRVQAEAKTEKQTARGSNKETNLSREAETGVGFCWALSRFRESIDGCSRGYPKIRSLFRKKSVPCPGMQ